MVIKIENKKQNPYRFGNRFAYRDYYSAYYLFQFQIPHSRKWCFGDEGDIFI